jgi:hypothetical protein
VDSAATAIGRAQALLDPTGQQLFSSVRLMPYLNIAYAALREEAASARAITVAEEVLILPGVPAGTRDLGDFVKPGGVLACMAAPVSLRERPAGGDSSQWTDVARTAELPAREPEARLHCYEWRGGNLFFIGATEALDLEIRFEQLWPAIREAGQALEASGIANILGFWTAGLMAAAMREQALSTQLIAQARHFLDRWMQQRVLDAQGVTLRPRPFRDPGLFFPSLWI